MGCLLASSTDVKPTCFLSWKLLVHSSLKRGDLMALELLYLSFWVNMSLQHYRACEFVEIFPGHMMPHVSNCSDLAPAISDVSV